MPRMQTQTELTVYFDIDPILEQIWTYQFQQYEDMMTELTSAINPPGMDPLFFAGNEGDQPWLSFYKYGLNCGEWRWRKLYFDHTGRLDWRLTIMVPPQVLREFDRRRTARPAQMTAAVANGVRRAHQVLVGNCSCPLCTTP